jgi:hypothetical protein
VQPVVEASELALGLGTALIAAALVVDGAAR